MILLAPEVGLEPTTLRLTAKESLDPPATIDCYKFLSVMHLWYIPSSRIAIHTCPIVTHFERAWAQKWVQLWERMRADKGRSGRSRITCVDFEHSAFDFLKIGDHLKEVSRLRVPCWAEHSHETLWRPAKSSPEFKKANRSVDVLAQYRLPRLHIPRDHASYRFAQERAAKLHVLFEVRLNRIAKLSRVCHRSPASLSSACILARELAPPLYRTVAAS